MSEQEDESQKTEQPTERRLEDALKRGQVVYSREITTFLMFLALAISVAWIVPSMGKEVSQDLSQYIGNSYMIDVSQDNIGNLAGQVVLGFFRVITIPLILAIIAAVFSSFIQNGRFVTSLDPLMPKMERISLLAGFKRIFSLRSVVELVKGIIKICIVSFVIYLIIEPKFQALIGLYDRSLEVVNLYIYDLAVELLVAICVIMAIIAAIDYIYQRHLYMKNLMMSKHDIKQEYKEMEGSPEIKGKLKQIRMQRARRRMMAEVPKADVVITNPTHFAVALSYDQAKFQAPIVVAKGQDNVALMIRKIAKDNDVPIVENPPLARALYSAVELDEEVPLEHYKAVAEVITYVYKLKNRIPG